MTLWHNKEGRVRLGWRLAGILLSSFILIMAVGFSLGLVGETQAFLDDYGTYLSVIAGHPTRT